MWQFYSTSLSSLESCKTPFLRIRLEVQRTTIFPLYWLMFHMNQYVNSKIQQGIAEHAMDPVDFR